MKTRPAWEETPEKKRIRQSTLVTVIGDIILIAALVVCLLTYISRNHVDTYNQNISNITSISKAKSELMLAALENTNQEVKSAYRYCNGREIAEVLDYLYQISDIDSEFQLLMRDDEKSSRDYHVYKGFSTRKLEGEFIPIVYDNMTLSESIYLHASQEDGEISYSQSFTNKTDALRYFAVFCGINIFEDGKSQHYYLIKPQKESKVLDQLQTYTQYSRLATAICYSDGKYLARDNAFRSDNFYDYLYDYNHLSMDERNRIKINVQNNPEKTGVLAYRDYAGRDTVFVYATCGDTEIWNIIVSVPVDEFVSNELLSFFPTIIILFLVLMFIFNTWRLLNMVRELARSFERERIANSSKSSFLSRMSHEIRTPLNAIIGYNVIAKTEISDAKNDVDCKQAEMNVMNCLDKSEIASKHLLTIINDVLDMSAIESGKMTVTKERFDFKGLITSLTTIFYSQAKTKGVEFEVILDTLTEEWFIGDQMRTNQILANLLSNAIKFTPEGGTVKLKIYQPDAADNASHIHFEVSDTGIGMTQDYLDRIWTPFEQADDSISRRFGGTGLGLSITKNLVDLMGGTITVQSTPGIGTTFEIDLSYERTEQPAATKAYNFNMVNALVVDDDVSTCEYIRLLFQRCGARCATVTSGRDAVKAVSVAKARGEEYSLYLIDWRMPSMDGIETIRRIREIAGDRLPLIVLTAYDYTEISEKANEVGVNRFISKPLFQSTLFNLLTSVSGVQPELIEKREKKPDFTGVHVILAEDNKMNMEIAKKILKSTGMTVHCAWNGKEAVELFELSAPGTFSIILMDIHMPVMNGHEASRTIRALSHPDAKTIPIIAMTADAFAENVAEARNAGMNDHIAKPIDFQLVFTMLGKYLDSVKD